MASKRKKPRSAALNAGIVVALLAVVLTVVLVARQRDRKAQLIVPEEHAARQAMRAAPENGFAAVREAIALMPARPKPRDFGRVDGSMHRPWEEGETRPLGTGGLAELCLIELPDSDPQVAEYVKACAPAVAKAQAALASPHIMFPEPREFVESRGEEEWLNLVRAMFAAGRVQFEATPEADALRPLIDGIRLVRKLNDHENLMAWAQVLEGLAWQQVRGLGLDPSRRPLLEDALKALGPGYTPSSRVLHTMFLHIDDQLARQATSAEMHPERRIFRGVFLYDLQRTAIILHDNRDALYKLVDESGLDIDKWLYDNARPSNEFGSILRRINMTIRRALELRSDFEATRIALALAAYHAEKGAYPATLAELAPAHLPSVPADPFNGAPFGYKSADPNAYVLYGPGYDAADDGGSPEKDRIIEQVPRPVS